ncbi:hypothetical protein HMPREF9248_0343 [Fannyhessea vaginae PB189-T1-4]|uniref:Uncharacterized protein n=1 Tax=Fannyhessea vaginae PB189-T1-4 TaxID=866774 RepID=A0ABN0AZY2_9ACTN|nr:hypothetical protein [Fannyhessea vaginae]EFL44062.1 hypothetical protein HMPREF9248_0343 [Fannyhessea vaginae PB189-T1-4]
MASKQARNKTQGTTKAQGTTKRQASRQPVRFHGVITQDMVEEQTARSGLAPFTFTSAFIVLGMGLIGGVVLPGIAGACSADVPFTLFLTLPLFLAAALAFCRYFVDTHQGMGSGFYLTFLVCWAVSALIVYLLVYQGIFI